MSDLERLIDKYPNEGWNWYELSTNPAISLKYIKKHINRFHFKYLSKNPNLTILFFELHMNQKYLINKYDENVFDILEIDNWDQMIDIWNWKWLTTNPCFSIQYIAEHKEYPWVWEKLYKNPNITFSIINKELNLNIKTFPNARTQMSNCDIMQTRIFVCDNNLNFDLINKFIQENEEEVDFEKLSRNQFLNSRMRNNAALKIQQRWKKWWYSPRGDLPPRCLVNDINEFKLIGIIK